MIWQATYQDANGATVETAEYSAPSLLEAMSAAMIALQDNPIPTAVGVTIACVSQE